MWKHFILNPEIVSCYITITNISIGLQILVTIGGFQLQTSCIRRSYLTYCLQEFRSSNLHVVTVICDLI